jgi:hypothetical protein
VTEPHGNDYDWAAHWSRWLQQQMGARRMTRVQLIERAPLKDNGRPAFDQSILGRWLDGTHQPSFDKAVAVARALGVSPREAVWEAGFRPTPDSPVVVEQGDVSSLILQVSDDDEMEAVLDFLKLWRRRPHTP